ncbi:MAG: VOC family protein [Gemmatimonadota bacterium]
MWTKANGSEEMARRVTESCLVQQVRSVAMRRPRRLLAAVLVLALTGSVSDGEAVHEFTGLKVRLQTADVAATVSFYRDILGLEVVDQWSGDGDSGVIFGLEDDSGAAFLEFGKVATPNNGAASVQFRVGDMASFLDRLGDGWAVDGPHERPWGSVYSYIRDPNGVQVIVFTGRV